MLALILLTMLCFACVGKPYLKQVSVTAGKSGTIGSSGYQLGETYSTTAVIAFDR